MEWFSFVLDIGRGLNAELQPLAGRLKAKPLLVVQADLRLVCSEEIEMLLAEADCSIAPNWRGIGTNAIAICDPSKFEFSFGEGSFARHFASGRVNVVRQFGLGHDIDSLADLDVAKLQGFDLESQFGLQ